MITRMDLRVTAVGAGLLLQANGLAVLGGLGLDERLRADGFLSYGVPVRAADGAVLSSLPVPDFGAGLDRVLAVRRSAVNEALLDAVRAEPGIELRLGVEVRGDERFDGDLVVGADGVSSVVRSSGDFGARIRRTGAVYLRGLVPLAGKGNAGEYWTPSGLFGGAPVDATTQYFYASATAPAVREAVTARDLPALRRAWAAALPAAAAAFDAVEWFDDLLVHEVVRVDCARWADGRRVQDAADRLAKLAHWRGRTTTRLRDGLLRAVDRRAGLAERLVRATMQEHPVALRGLVGRLTA
jgi:salicylate hydroxylase